MEILLLFSRYRIWNNHRYHSTNNIGGMLMTTELVSEDCFEVYEEYTKTGDEIFVYRKEQVDSYVKEKEEEHRKEVDQLIFEIERLKKELDCEKASHDNTRKISKRILEERNELQNKLSYALSEKEKWINKYNYEIRGYNH